MAANISFKRLFFSFDGRINRATYWTRAVPVLLASALLINAAFAVETRIFLRPAIVSFTISLASLLPVLAVTVKRLHDRGRSGRFLLALLIPIVGPIWLLAEVWLLPGNDGANQFGDPHPDNGVDRRWVVPFEIACSVVLVALVVWTYSLPGPVSMRAVEVDTAEVRREPMVVTLNGEGKTREATRNSSGLEIIVDYPAADAANFNPGQRVIIEYQGESFLGQVRNVEPAFSKISSLGVEEQRINVIVRVVSAADSEDFAIGQRTLAKIVIWEDEQALSVPRSALFRRDGKWAVFVDLDGRAQQRIVTIGHTNDILAEVRAGIEAGDNVILYPSNLINDGVRISSRN
jgi:uncharacterized membrane protein YhaH (DUF805 family)